jgi:hypothetical protein
MGNQPQRERFLQVCRAIRLPAMTCRRTKLKLFVYGLIATVVLVAIIAAIVRLNPHGSISRANYNKIRPGMVMAEVEAFLGAPSDDLPPLSYEDIHADESAARDLS